MYRSCCSCLSLAHLIFFVDARVQLSLSANPLFRDNWLLRFSAIVCLPVLYTYQSLSGQEWRRIRLKDRRSMDRARAELERVDAAWSAAASTSRDVEQIVSFWADDA